MYVVKTLQLKRWLEENGFKAEGTMPHKDIEKFIVWLFEDSEALREAITIYTELKNNKKI